jgi:hypothetical protein
MNPNTVEYRGYQIDPVNEAGRIVPIEDAVCFQIFPPNEAEPALDVDTYTLETAQAVVDLDIDIEEGAPF